MHTQKEMNPDFLDREDIKNEINSFKEFAFKKDMIQLSIAFILGGACNKVIASISNNLVMPIVNVVLMHTGADWRTFVWEIGNIKLEVGQLLGTMFDFLITALVLYVIFAKVMQGIWKKVAGKDKKKEMAKAVPICIQNRP